MKTIAVTAALVAAASDAVVRQAAAMPLRFSEAEICANGRNAPGISCSKPNMEYERILDVQAGFQWDDAGGYCGSWASQRATMAKGAWISQQQVRDHTSPCGGHDNEILSCNVEEAYRNLKLSYEAFDYHNTPVPQQAVYAKWLKRQLADGHAVAWMIMWSGQDYPIYDLKPPAGMYGHVEPVIGIQSNHPLNDTTVYDDDVVVHLTDGGTSTVHRTLTSIPCKWKGEGTAADCGHYRYGMGPYSFGYAVKGFVGSRADAQPAYLHVQPWLREPDTRSGDQPSELQGTLTVSGLVDEHEYQIYRWDTVKDAFNYANEFVQHEFKQPEGGNSTYSFTDDRHITSNGTTYYSCVPKVE